MLAYIPAPWILWVYIQRTLLCILLLATSATSHILPEIPQRKNSHQRRHCSPATSTGSAQNGKVDAFSFGKPTIKCYLWKDKIGISQVIKTWDVKHHVGYITNNI